MKRYMMLFLLAAVMVAFVAGCGGKNPVAPGTANMSDPLFVAGALIGNSLDTEQMASLLDQPATFQLEVAKNIAIKQGKTELEADVLVADLAKNQPMASALKSKTSVLSVMGCNQTVEYKTVVRDPVWAYSYRSYFDVNRGTEYLYSYNPWWTVSPDNIRWASTDGQVTWALMVCYGGNLAGYNLCGKPFQIETGDKGTWWAGGADRIFHSMYAHHL